MLDAVCRCCVKRQAPARCPRTHTQGPLVGYKVDPAGEADFPTTGLARPIRADPLSCHVGLERLSANEMSGSTAMAIPVTKESQHPQPVRQWMQHAITAPRR